MARKNFRLVGRGVGEIFFKRRCDPCVQRPAGLAKKRAIGRVLNKSVLEQVSHIRRRALAEQQTGVNKTPERFRQVFLVFLRHRRQQRMGKFAPDRRAYLSYLLGRAQPVETRHQRGVQA